MTDYEYNARIERKRAAYLARRAAESPAFKAVCEGFASLEAEMREQGRQFVAALTGQEYVLEERPQKAEEERPYTFLEYIAAIKEYGDVNAEFDNKLIKRSGFEW